MSHLVRLVFVNLSEYVSENRQFYSKVISRKETRKEIKKCV